MVPYSFYGKKIKQTKAQMSLWLKRSLTVLGRISVVKSLLVSTLNYLFLTLPNPTDETMKKIDRSFHNFIWEGKPDNISRTQLSHPYHLGGAKMMNVYTYMLNL